jgi:hypothetical protein
MAYGGGSSLRVRASARRNAHRKIRLLRTTAIGVAAGGLVCASVVAMAVGVAHVVSASVDLRANARSIAAAVPQFRQAGLAPRQIDRAAQMVIIASLQLPEPKPILAMPALDPIKTVAVNIPAPVGKQMADPLFDPIYTGALAPVSRTASAAPAAEAVAPVRPPSTPSVRKQAAPRARLASLSPPSGADAEVQDDSDSAGTAIYDITAQTVYLPSGERLEAHSGLGSMMDDPRHVSQKNRGPTPPNVYKLKLREALFHGVQAIRLTPVNESGMFGRDGILAHTYMLGPSGQSNGCVSFRDYPRFLRAFLRGEFDRIVVVSRLPKPPVFASRSRFRSASNKTL